MSNVFKTALLLAVLTALLVMLGGAIGGRSGMTIALVMALVMNFVSYWWSDKIVLAMYRAQPITEAQAPGLYNMVRRIASRAGSPMHPVGLTPSEHNPQISADWHVPDPGTGPRKGMTCWISKVSS